MLRFADSPGVFRREVDLDGLWPAPDARAPARAAAETADVLAVNRVGSVGAAERVLLTAAQALSERGWTTALACPAGALAAEALAAGMPLYVTEPGAVSRSQSERSPEAWWRLACRARRASRAILGAARQTRARILHVHDPAVALHARQAARRLGAPVIWHLHETAPMSAPYRLMGAAAARCAALVICVSKASCDMARELGVPQDRIRLIYNAAEPRFFAPVAMDGEAWPPGPHVGLFGALEPRKGHADAIRALAIASEAWPTLQLWIVGEAGFERQADYRSALERLAQGLGVADRVHFTGRRTDVPQLMARMDAVVCASVCCEGPPTVLVEACAMGRPVVATDVGGTSEIIRNGFNGALAPPGAPHALAEALGFVLSGRGAELGRRGRADADQRFAPARFAAAVEDCYRALALRAPERAA